MYVCRKHIPPSEERAKCKDGQEQKYNHNWKEHVFLISSSLSLFLRANAGVALAPGFDLDLDLAWDATLLTVTLYLKTQMLVQTR